MNIFHKPVGQWESQCSILSLLEIHIEDGWHISDFKPYNKYRMN